jgi:carboxyl-terminal processing protease
MFIPIRLNGLRLRCMNALCRLSTCFSPRHPIRPLYSRIVKKAFRSIIFLISFPGFVVGLSGQVAVPNGGFEMGDGNSSTGSQHWEVEMGIDRCYLDSSTKWSGKYSLHVVKENPKGLGFFKQQFPFAVSGLRRYRVTCAIRSDFEGDGLAGLGCRVFDAEGNTVCGYLALHMTGNHGWKEYTGEFYANERAASLRIFGRIEGTGEVWFDAIRVEEVPFSGEQCSRKVDRYISEYFGLVRKYSILEDTSHLTRLEADTWQLCASNSQLSHCHNILKRYTTLNLRDGHSFFSTPKDWKDMNSGSAMQTTGLANFAEGKLLQGNIGYVHVPTYASLDMDLNRRYVDSLQSLIATLEKSGARAWIIDIHDNQGGNSFAMLPGLGPLLGNGICGYSISGDGSKRTRRYNEGWAGWDDSPLFEMNHAPYHLLHEDPPIAVIYGRSTGCSGEVVAISFRGKPNTRSFGQPTAGATTRVDNLRLPDGAYLNLACGYDMDRNEVVYKGPVPPDVETADHEKALDAAEEWLRQQLE